MLPLRVWLQAHLMWDPSRDQNKLTREFLDGYYGPAGPYLSQYLELVNEISKDPKARIHCFNDNLDYLTPEIVAKCNRMFDDAEKAVAGNAELERRGKSERRAPGDREPFGFCFSAAKK